MLLRNDPARWGAVSISLHWLTVALVVSLAGIGLLMTDLPNGTNKLQVYALHKSLGLTVLGLTAVRLLWRLASPAPAPLAAPAWQERIARATHFALYLLLLLVPLSGWWFNSASGFPLRWFGLVSLPKLSAYDPAMKGLARETHELLFYSLAGLVLVHAGAALWHHYRVRDRTLVRMLPILEAKAEPTIPSATLTESKPLHANTETPP